MSGAEVRDALSGEASGLVTGVSWLPEPALRAVVQGTGAEGPADSLAVFVTALDLDFAFVPAGEGWAMHAIAALHRADAAGLWAVAGVLGRIGQALGWSQMLATSASEPGLLAVPIAEALHDALDDVRAGIAAEADAIVVADDLAGAAGPLISPDFALDALLPCYARLATEAAEAGRRAVFHADGDIRALVPALARAGFSGLHLGGLGPDAFANAFAAARVEGLVVLGGIEGASVLSGARRAGTAAARYAETGGLIVCDDGGLTSPEEIAAYASALEAARDSFAPGA